MKVFLSFLPIIIASIVIGLGTILIIDNEKKHLKSAKKKI